MNFFGYYNGLAPLFELGHWTPRIQADALCSWCEGPIINGENGVILDNGGCEHIECFICSIVGSVIHQEKICSCYGGTFNCLDEPDRRKTAKTAFCNWQKWGDFDSLIKL